MYKKTPLVIFADDYGRHPSSCQHLINCMIAHREVLWINTIGTRRLSLSMDDMKRGLEKIRQWQHFATKPTANGPIVYNPPMLPSFSSRVARKLNANILSMFVSRAIERHLSADPIIITTIPVTSDLVGRIPARRWLYYCVDDFAAWPGLDTTTLQHMEQKLLSLVDDVTVVSEPLAERARAVGHKPTIITHGIDLEIWARTGKINSDNSVLKYLADLPRPCAVFWGLIDPRIDNDVLAMFAEMWNGSIALVGPTQGSTDALKSISNVHLTGSVPREHLPHVAQLADMLIMPYRKCEVTRAMQPLKLLEYLATDKPVVCTDLPALTAWADCCDVVDNANFAKRACEVYARGLTDMQRHNRNRRLPNESWQAKARSMELMIDTFDQQNNSKITTRVA